MEAGEERPPAEPWGRPCNSTSHYLPLSASPIRRPGYRTGSLADWQPQTCPEAGLYSPAANLSTI